VTSSSSPVTRRWSPRAARKSCSRASLLSSGY
jgi:hypothetical protein